MSISNQPPQIEESLSLADLAPDPGADYGEVFTRRWVVEMILDLVGYTADKDLASQVLVEPSCGTGAFLGPVVQRLVESSRRHGHELTHLGPAIRAFDLLEANAERAQKAAVQQLLLAGVSQAHAETIAAGWVTTGDFILQPHVQASADYVVGNPPYIRLENVPSSTMDAYRETCSTMRGRADIYVGFIELGLRLLKPGGLLSFICADRWMRNQYGADLRELVTSTYAVDAVISMHDVDVFEDEVSAYPAIVVLRNQAQAQSAVVDANSDFSSRDAKRLSSWVRRGRLPALQHRSYEATRVDGWFSGRDLWPTGSPKQLALIADLEARYPPLQDSATGTRVGIGVATGCDELFITGNPHLVEEDRLLPLLQASDTSAGTADWSGHYLVNPWTDSGLVDLDQYPLLAGYFERNAPRLRARHVARHRPLSWYRTIDRVDHGLQHRPKLVFPDMKARAHPVLDPGDFYPHHNLYYVVSDVWDLEVLGGLLISDVANLFVGAYCVRMRGGTYRFQAQYLRRIRVPDPASICRRSARALASAFAARDAEKATRVAAALFGISASDLDL